MKQLRYRVGIALLSLALLAAAAWFFYSIYQLGR